jgi:hypothetical protein
MVTGSAAVPADTSSFGLIHDLGDGLKLYMADLSKLREQDVNARIMSAGEHNQMVNNMRKRGRMESVPYCVLSNGTIEIVSGHHRVRAAREAGISLAPVLVDESGLQRSEIVAKQLAHNRLVGTDDPQTLKKLFELLDTPDDILQSGLAADMMDIPEVDLDKLLVPHLDMDWKVVTFSFLPHQLSNLQLLLDTIPASDHVLVAPVEQFDEFMKAVVKLGRLKKVTNASTVLALTLQKMVDEISSLEELSEDDPDEGWDG